MREAVIVSAVRTAIGAFNGCYKSVPAAELGAIAAKGAIEKAGINPETRVRDLTDEEVAKIREIIDESQQVEGDLRREIALNIKRLKEIGCYRGIRHRRGLPVRGQKTKTNARTCKGPKRTVANKKK